MSPLSLGGLASGIDTETIVTQLMAAERQPRTRLQLADTRAQARQTGLRDLATKLGAVRDAANALKSTTTWANVQTVTSGDPARVAARAAAGAAPGTHEIVVTSLAVTAQQTFDYTKDPASTQTIAIGAFSFDVGPDSAISTVVAAINASDLAPVSAVAVGDKLVLTSRTSGVPGNFTVAATSLLAADSTHPPRAGANPVFTIDGQPPTTPQTSNLITDQILGVEMTLKATTTSPVSVTVGDPALDTDSVKAKVTAFVTAYNGAVELIRGKLSEERVRAPSTNAEAAKGLFRGDSMLRGALGAMRAELGDLSSFGISTGAATGSATFSADAVAGKLTIDDAKLTAALASDPDALRSALDGLGQRLSDVVTPVAGAGVTDALDGVSAERRRLADAIARTDVRLAGREQRLRAQFAAMESALAASQNAQAQFASQLAGLSRN